MLINLFCSERWATRLVKCAAYPPLNLSNFNDSENVSEAFVADEHNFHTTRQGAVSTRIPSVSWQNLEVF
jgi:hypothetical protein